MLITLADYERAAAESLDVGVQAYYFGGAADEVTLGDNEAAWRRLALHSSARRLLRLSDFRRA